MNNLSLNFPPSSDTLWYTPMDHHHHHHHHHQQKPFPLIYSLPQNDDVESSDNNSSSNHPYASETASSLSPNNEHQRHREHMFEKPLTPSDVGKLNRLVIPKQHAEKYFPLAGVSTSSAVEGGGGGGLILGFEDESGKCWRFRYSYWNSSQSYVLTKGWSRYVKEKKLDAGDVVLFERHRVEPDRFFIGWRRRGSAGPGIIPPVRPAVMEEFKWTSGNASVGQRSSSFYNAVQLRHHSYPAPPTHRIPAADYFHAVGTEVRQQEISQKPAKSSGGNPKRLRLFGVNLECPFDDDEPAEPDTEPQTSDGSSLSSQGPVHGSGSGVGPTGYNNHFDYVGYPPSHHHLNHMDINQMRNRLG